MPDKDFMGQSWTIWAWVTVAVFLRILAKPPEGETFRHRAISMVFSVTAGFAIGIAFYRPVVEWRALDPAIWDVPVAILLAFTGANLAKFMANVVGDVEKMKEIITIWRGGRK